MWTLKAIGDIRDGVTNNTIPKKWNIKGNNYEPLCDDIPSRNCIIPILHLLIGLGNKAIKVFVTMDMRKSGTNNRQRKRIKE